MLELKKAGLYIANGKNTSVLIRVGGEAPMLDIISGVLLNDMEKDGTITKLDKDSVEIQDIMLNPKNYIFEHPAVSEAVKMEAGLEGTTKARPEFTDSDFNDWVEKYKEFRVSYPENYEVKLTAFLIRFDYSKTQADMIIRQIKTRLRLQGYSI